MIAIEIALRVQGVHEFEAAFRALRHPNSSGTIQGNHGRWIDALENAVELRDLRPVCVSGCRSLAMKSRDGRLNCEWTDVAIQSLLDEGQSFVDLRAVPAATILILEQHKFAGSIEAGVAPGIVEEHEREQTGGLRWRRLHQVLE
jgi:hypothetical protein